MCPRPIHQLYLAALAHPSTVPTAPLHCTHRTPPLYQRTPPLYPPHPPTVPTAPLHCTHRTPPLYPPHPSTVPTAPLHCTHRTPPLYPPHPSTVPTAPLHRTPPTVPPHCTPTVHASKKHMFSYVLNLDKFRDKTYGHWRWFHCSFSYYTKKMDGSLARFRLNWYLLKVHAVERFKQSLDPASLILVVTFEVQGASKKTSLLSINSATIDCLILLIMFVAYRPMAKLALRAASAHISSHSAPAFPSSEMMTKHATGVINSWIWSNYSPHLQELCMWLQIMRNCRSSASPAAWHGGHSTKFDSKLWSLTATRLCDSISFIRMSFSVRVMSHLWLSLCDTQSSVLLAKAQTHLDLHGNVRVQKSRMSKALLHFPQMRTISLRKKWSARNVCLPMTNQLHPSTVPTAPPLYPLHPSTVPIAPLDCITAPYPPYLFSKEFCQPILHFCQPILHFCRPILHFCRPTFGVQWVGYSGTVQVVQWYGTMGTVVRCRGCSGAVQRVQWYGTSGTVAQYSGTVQWYSARVQSTVRLTHGCMHTDGKSELSTCSPISSLAEVSPQHVTPKYTFVTPWFVVQSVSRLIPALRLSLAQQSCQT